MRPAFSLGDAGTPLPYPSLAAAIYGGVEMFPDGRFLYFSQDGSQREISYSETLERAHRLLAGMRRCGMQVGDVLIITLSEAKDIIPALWATAIGGFVAVPDAQSGLSRNLAFLQSVFGRIHVLADRAEATVGSAPLVLEFENLASTPSDAKVERVASNAEDLRFGILTSGTTGLPRLVGLSDRAALARWWPQLPDAAHARGFLSWSSFDHVMGVGLAMPNLPKKVHLDAARFVATPLSWVDALDATRATHATMTNFGMSLVLQAIAENPDRSWRLDHVRKIGIGAEAISRASCNRFLKCLGTFGLREDALILGYGLSECGPVVGGSTPFLVQEANDVDSPPELDRPTVDHAVRIVGDDGYLLREGDVGRIEVRGPTMTSGYIGDDAATATLFTSDRWLRTGDLGLVRNGKLTVVGREKELIIVNAKKYSCADVEAAVLGRTDLGQVYAAPLEAAAQADESAPGAPCAVFVVVDRPDELSPKTVADAVRAATADAFRFAPRVVALILHDDVPRTSLAKVRRLELPSLLPKLESEGWVDCLAEQKPIPLANPQDEEIEARIFRIWRELLRSDGEIDRDTDFFALGGDSLLALRMSFLMEEEFGIQVRTDQFPAKLSVAELALVLSGRPADSSSPPLRPTPNSVLPDWLVARLRGFLESWPGLPVLKDGFIRRVGSAQQGVPVFWCMQTADEAQHFERTTGGRRPSYTMRSGVSLLDYDTPLADALVDRYVDEITAICHDGPVVIGGNCQGVVIALAITRRLVAKGREVRLLAAADCRFAEQCGGSPVPVPVALFPAVGSKFNPYRYFRHPEISLRKLAPYGLRIEMINASYAYVMVGPAMEHVADRLEAAIDWAKSRDLTDSAAVHTIPNATYHRNIASTLNTLELRAGERLDVPISLKNISPIAWEPFASSGLTIANRWLSDRGEMLISSDGRAPLSRMEPGMQTDMTLSVIAPHRSGSYLLEIDLVEEGVCWFGDVGAGSIQIPAIIMSRDEDDMTAGMKWEVVSRSRIFRLHQRARKLLGLPHLV